MAGNFSNEDVLLAILVELRVLTKLTHETYLVSGKTDDLVSLRADEENLVGPINSALSQKG